MQHLDGEAQFVRRGARGDRANVSGIIAGIVERSLAVWTRVLGVLLIVLGTVLLLAPDVTYDWRERVLHTPSVDVTARRERVIVVPRALSVLVIGAGIVALVAARKRGQS